MDPTQCYQELLAARAAHDNETASEYAINLRDWLLKGGFPPTGVPLNDVHQAIADTLGSMTTAAEEGT